MGLHALVQPAPQLLVLQLKRYSRIGGETIKDFSEISIAAGSTVCIPCFHNQVDDSTYTVQYDVPALVFHLGDEPHSGHYRAALSGVSYASRGECHDGCVFYLTDDNVPLCEGSRVDPAINCNGYLVGLLRISHRAEGRASL